MYNHSPEEKNNRAKLINGRVVKNKIKHQSPATLLLEQNKEIGQLKIKEIIPTIIPTLNQYGFDLNQSLLLIFVIQQ